MTEPDKSEVLGGVLGPVGPEIGCDECFEKLDRYVEIEVGGGDPDSAVPGMRAHLDGCPACSEEYDSLVALLRSQ
jgi:hypothetical protein